MLRRVNNDCVLIAGGGLTGLMCALKIRRLHPGKRIVLLERSNQLGGLYGSRLYSDNIRFDNGMHVIYESCNPEIDDLYREIMPEEEWNIYEGNEKDIAGLFYRGRLQNYSHYVDLRSFPSEVRKSFIGSLVQNLEASQVAGAKSAMDFLRKQFGEEVVEAVHRPILEMMYGVNPESLDVFATKASALERVTLFDPATMLDLMKSPMLRSRLAFPDQLNLPPLRENNQKALYPKKFGMSHFIDKLRDHLESMDVEILTETDISQIHQNEGRIERVTLSNKNQESRTLHVGRMLWTAGWSSLAKELGVSISDLTFQRGPEMVFMNLIFDRPLAMDRLYYFYCYDEGFASFRVTNYANYCPSAAKDGRFPMCVELWPSKIGKRKADMGQEECVQLAINELRRFGVIGLDHNLVFSRMENNVGEFPMPTLHNTKSLQELRARVMKRSIANLSVAGLMAEDGLFFIPDILNDAFAKLHDF